MFVVGIFLSGHPAKDWDRMDIDLIPTQNLGHSKRQQANQVNVERVQRRKRRQEAIQQKAMTTLVIEMMWAKMAAYNT